MVPSAEATRCPDQDPFGAFADPVGARLRVRRRIKGNMRTSPMPTSTRLGEPKENKGRGDVPRPFRAPSPPLLLSGSLGSCFLKLGGLGRAHSLYLWALGIRPWTKFLGSNHGRIESLNDEPEAKRQFPREYRGGRDHRPHGDLLVESQQRCGSGSEDQG